MSDATPHGHHSDDARADDAPPTDAVTDEVRQDAAQAESGAPQRGDAGSGGSEAAPPAEGRPRQDAGPEDLPGESALTHP
jgi:hypothetical protein